MIQCVLINNSKFKIVLEYIKDVDYYTDIFIKLITPFKELTIYKDNFLALRNIVLGFKILDLVNYRENDLGLVLSKYFKKSFYTSEDYDINDIRKYCILEVKYYATWLYKCNQKIVLLVTPMAGDLGEEGYNERYSNFINNYHVLFKENISLQDLKKAKKIILDLYDKLF